MIPTFVFTGGADVWTVLVPITLLGISAGAFIAALSNKEEPVSTPEAEEARTTHGPLDRAA